MPRPTKIALFEDYLRHRIASAAPNWIPANVLLREIQQMGFAGSERTVRNLERLTKWGDCGPMIFPSCSVERHHGPRTG